MLKRFVMAAVAVGALMGIAVAAHAGSCTTTCSRVGNYTYCNQNCW